MFIYRMLHDFLFWEFYLSVICHLSCCVVGYWLKIKPLRIENIWNVFIATWNFATIVNLPSYYLCYDLKFDIYTLFAYYRCIITIKFGCCKCNIIKQVCSVEIAACGSLHLYLNRVVWFPFILPRISHRLLTGCY